MPITSLKGQVNISTKRKGRSMRLWFTDKVRTSWSDHTCSRCPLNTKNNIPGHMLYLMTLQAYDFLIIAATCAECQLARGIKALHTVLGLCNVCSHWLISDTFWLMKSLRDLTWLVLIGSSASGRSLEVTGTVVHPCNSDVMYML